MLKPTTDTSEYFRQYRRELGFTNNAVAKSFLGAKDITPKVDLDYVKCLNSRLCEIIDKLNDVVADEIKVEDLTTFKENHIYIRYLKL